MNNLFRKPVDFTFTSKYATHLNEIHTNHWKTFNWQIEKYGLCIQLVQYSFISGVDAVQGIDIVIKNSLCPITQS